MKFAGSPASSLLESVRLKTILLAASLILIITALGTEAVTLYQGRQLQRQADGEARLFAEVLEGRVSDAMLHGEASRVQRLLEEAGGKSRVAGVWLTDAKGTVVAASSAGDVGLSAGAVLRKKPEYVLSRTVPVRNRRECGGCHAKETEMLGYMTVGLLYGRPLRDIGRLRTALFTGAVLLVIALGFSLLHLLTKSVTTPVRMLSEAMEQAGVEFNFRMEAFLTGGIKGMHDGFTSLIGRIRDSRERSERAHIDELRKYSKELERINASLDEKINKLSALSGIGRSMNATHKLDDLLRMIITSAVRELKADRGSVMLHERGVGELFIHTGKGLSPEHQRINRFRVGEGVAGWAAMMKRPALVEDTRTDTRYLPGKGFPHGKSMLSVPLISTGGELLGVINLERGAGRKPFTQAEQEYMMAIAGQASVATENVELIQNLHKSYYDTISALAQAVEAKDPYTVGHCERVTQYAIAVAEDMGLSDEEVEVVRYGATLHDLGKIGVSESVLNKPGRLTDEEYELIKEHAAIGENIIRGVDFLQKVRPIVRNHQERHDGQGYPDGLKGGEIPLSVAIVTVADNYDALTTDRPYRKALTNAEAAHIILEDRGKKYNPEVVDAFMRIFGHEDARKAVGEKT